MKLNKDIIIYRVIGASVFFITWTIMGFVISFDFFSDDVTIPQYFLYGVLFYVLQEGADILRKINKKKH